MVTELEKSIELTQFSSILEYNWKPLRLPKCFVKETESYAIVYTINFDSVTD